eukprot:MONOS_10500.1-p1 / transcript=MONOS_10500.1 / gene=MONOS_10500 / organism=Monocercomonoides_exilis_PA203 / gene_product=unspecified product / transcript_product=unspecified product / location=Mono_scaffold00480:7770-9188(-) / protein_length=431 / sequence_SO=supercontig / SO=protein_coding / is_pseudo=false
MQETGVTERLNELFYKLEHCDEDEQKQKIEEMNEMINEMDGKEFRSVFTTELFNRIDKMIEVKKLPLEIAILLLKRVGFFKVLKGIWINRFNESSLEEKFKEIIYDENEKKDEDKDEIIFVDICECYFMLDNQFSSDMYPLCVSCLLNVASSKEKKEEAQKKVVIALLALNCIEENDFFGRELYLKEITEIIKYHQEHRNLARLGYQSVWHFMIKRFLNDKSLEGVIENELHFGREAKRELKELMKCVNWKKKEEERGKGRGEETILMRWLKTLNMYICFFKLKNEELDVLINSIIQVFRMAKDNHGEICNWCIFSLRNAAENRNVEIEDLLKGGAADAVLEEIQRQTLNNIIVYKCLQFFAIASNRLKEEECDEMKEAKRKAAKRKALEKMEEEGCEDTITSFHKKFYYLNRKYHYYLSSRISDYFVNV